MKKSFICLLLISICLSSIGLADDLYRVPITSQGDADLLIQSKAKAVMKAPGAYLVLIDKESSEFLIAQGLEIKLLAENVDLRNLALENERGKAHAKSYPVLFEQDDCVLYFVDDNQNLMASDGSSLIPLRVDNLPIRYNEPRIFNSAFSADNIELDSLIDRMSYDSLSAYLYHLQSFPDRVAGSASNRAARDWIRTKLQSFGYTSAYIDPFYASTPYGYTTCYNVIAVKQGTTYPNRQVVIGAHFDAVVGSPGADDNGTGASAVMEMARVLADIPTEMTVIFALFDSEEQGLNGSFHYAQNAASAGDSIICMINMDMIGNIANDDYANVKYGDEMGYATLWIDLAYPLVNLSGAYSGHASNSDHYSFVEAGYDVVYAEEYLFSSVYHSPRDSTTYIDFDYFTRMAKATLATGYVITTAPLSIDIVSVVDVGDGQSLQINWIERDPSTIDHYVIYFNSNPPAAPSSVIVPVGQSSAIIDGLTTGTEYIFSIAAIATDGDMSILLDQESGIPYQLPQMPENLTARPVHRGVELNWAAGNTELDFSHYLAIRDGLLLPDVIHSNSYTDYDFSLGSGYHDYMIVAVDNGGLISDTVGVAAVSCRAATLDPGRVLAINRSVVMTPYIVDELETSEFLNDACAPYDYTYLSDTTHSTVAGQRVDLYDFLDYEVIVLGGESGRLDDFGAMTELGGILEAVDYYMSIGGKVIVFGRWGDLKLSTSTLNTITFSPGNDDYPYYSRFHINSRVQYLSTYSSSVLGSDLIGVHGQAPGYPDLAWDSLQTVAHSAPWMQCEGIPCPSFANLRSGYSQILYTYDSRTNLTYTEGKPMAWKYLGPDYQYIFFEFPLSFMERTSATTILRTAIEELLSAGPPGQTMIVPDSVETSTGPATVTIYLGDFLNDRIAYEIDLTQVVVNGSLIPLSSTVIASQPPFVSFVLEITVDREQFAASFGEIHDTVTTNYSVSWNFEGDPQVYNAYGAVTIMGETVAYIAGDANGDGAINIGDAVYIISYAFRDGPAPDPLAAGDANCDGSVNVGDAVFIINYAFRGGPPPPC